MLLALFAASPALLSGCKSAQCRIPHEYDPNRSCPKERRPPFSGSHAFIGFVLWYTDSCFPHDKVEFKPRLGDIYVSVNGCDLRSFPYQSHYHPLGRSWQKPGTVNIDEVLFVRQGQWFRWKSGELEKVEPQSKHHFYDSYDNPTFIQPMRIYRKGELEFWSNFQHSLAVVSLSSEDGWDLDTLVNMKCTEAVCQALDYHGAVLFVVSAGARPDSIEISQIADPELKHYEGTYITGAR
ncbi:MAG: hypothetical protein CMN76_03090 [Spirochaetaceae bacterium]|nr:hypothetical protein [Spirochaetaceae bacterium]